MNEREKRIKELEIIANETYKEINMLQELNENEKFKLIKLGCYYSDGETFVKITKINNDPENGWYFEGYGCVIYVSGVEVSVRLGIFKYIEIEEFHEISFEEFNNEYEKSLKLLNSLLS